MTVYRAIYKCRLCGKVFFNAATARRNTASFSVVHTALEASGITPPFALPNAPMQVDVHNCKDGSYGMSDFLGMKEVQENEAQHDGN